MSKVLNVSGHSVDLDSGRSLAPGDEADDVDTEHPHNRALVLAGLVTVTKGTTPRVSQPERLVELAPESTVDRVLARQQAEAEASASVTDKGRDDR